MSQNNLFGPLLQFALNKIADTPLAEAFENFSVRMSAEVVENELALPVILKLPTVKPGASQSWSNYKEMMQYQLEPARRLIAETMGAQAETLIAANAIKASLTKEQLEFLGKAGLQIEKMELDPLLQVVNMDDSVIDVDLPAFQIKHPGNTGKGVTVAVLDSGIDLKHPYLNVHASVSTCGESEEIPGSHGTHCAGSIASLDSSFPGIAPGVNLINIKVLTANGSGTHTNIVTGIDKALDMGAEVLSMSLGFNHLPSWSQGGHGWLCAKGHCPLCTAVDNAVALDGVIAVVAAGNEHERAEALRKNGYGSSFDTELGCPGQSREAITVGAITKRTFLPASFSSNGPTSYGTSKPDIVAPGVNITSTIPVPRQLNGTPVTDAARSLLFGRKSGTSMATPMVAGAVALIIEILKQNNTPVTTAAVKNALYTNGIIAQTGGVDIVGKGRLVLNML